MDNSCFNNIYDSFVKEKIGHAILFETNNPESCYEQVLELVKKINCPNSYSPNCNLCDICYQIANNIMPSVITIESTGETITKKSITDMMEYFNKKSVYIKYNVYIIKDAENLNDSSANTLLKFLEEPPAEVIAFLIARSKQNVIPTISSRCQCFHYMTEVVDEISQEMLDICLKYLNNIFCKENKIYMNKTFFSEEQMNDRNFFSLFFRGILFLLQKDIKNNCNDWNIDNIKHIKMSNLANEYLERNDVCVNKLIMLDNYYIKMKEVMK